MDNSVWQLVKGGKEVDFELGFGSINEFLSIWAKKYKNKTAVVFEPLGGKKVESISYYELDNLTTRIGIGLMNIYDLRAGDAVAFAFENSLEVILVNFACWRLGIVTVPLDTTRDTIDRKIYKLSQTAAKLLITSKRGEVRAENKQLKRKLEYLKVLEIISWKDLASLAGEIKAGEIKPRLATGNLPLSNDCLILYTSGTTADPKGAVLTGKSLMANAASIVDWLEFDEKDRWQVVLPLHHINSTTFVNTTLLAGGTVVLISGYSKSRFWEVMAKHKVTGTSIVPTVAYDLLSEGKSFRKNKKKLTGLRRIQLGSAPVQPSSVEKFMRSYNIPLVQGYGQTETSLRSTGVPMDLTPAQFEKVRKLNSVGTELTYTRVAVLDSKGEKLGENQEGEICIKGPIIMREYINNLQATREAFGFEWFHSGDTGYWRQMFGRKFFFLKGRSKEIIKKGGVLISPLAVENAILENYSIVEKVYVVGFGDERMGEEIGAVIVSGRKAFDDLKRDVVSGSLKGLKAYEMPKVVLLVSENDLPKTSTGKVQRILIREKYDKLFVEKNRTVVETDKMTIRLIGQEEQGKLKEAVTIHNQRWGKGLSVTLDQFRIMARNGLLFGAVDNKDRLVGSVAAIKLRANELKKAGQKGHWSSSWKTVTGNGVLATHDHRGDSLLCVTISVAGKEQRTTKINRKLKRQKITKRLLEKYLESDEDSVIRFHRRAKGGMRTGARIVAIIPGGRPDDKAALGYNLLMKYPDIKSKPRGGGQPFVGTLLIEGVMAYAFQNKISSVYVYTRPADLSKNYSK